MAKATLKKQTKTKAKAKTMAAAAGGGKSTPAKPMKAGGRKKGC